MEQKQVIGLLLLGVVVYSYFSTMPNYPVLTENKAVPEREDLTTGSPFKDGGDYQPSALSGSGEPPSYTSLMYQ
jgi:hypothetical protein